MIPFWKFIPRFDREHRLRDLAKAFKVLGSRRQTDVGSIERLFRPARVFFARSGRECLYLILKTLGLRPRSRVGTPLYCCMSVFEAVAASGHVPVFLDIDPDNYGIDLGSLRSNKGKLDALIVVHTFGYPNDLDGIRASLEGHNIPIIEDCAHSMLSEYRGRLTGTLTDAAFFSFGMHKPLATGGGGMIVLNKPEYAERAEQELAALPPESASEELRHAVSAWLRSLAYRRLLYGILMASPLGRWRDVDRGDPKAKAMEAIGASWSPARIRRVNRVLVEDRLRDFEAKLSRLAQNSRKLRKLVENTPLAVPPDPVWGKWNYFMLPVGYPSASQRDVAREFLRSRGVDTCALYQNCERNARLFGYQSGCPQAEEAARTLCTVPNHVWLSDRDIQHVGNCLCDSSELKSISS